MPGRRNPRAKWVLPEVIDPPDRICITIPVPNDRQHIAAFWGALYNLTSGIFWADDTAHTARLVAKVWQEIYDALKPNSCDITPPLAIEEWEDILSICESLRYQNGKLQGLCCGEWVDITGQGDSSLGGSGQPGGGAEQPAAGGPPVCYHGNQQAAFQWLAPTVVSAGDTLEFSNLDGAAWDGVAPFPLPGRWDCPTGKFFFAGECQNATETLVGGDPLPTAPHMSLVCQIAGTWYSCLAPITVPGGVSAAQVVVQLNDSAISDNQGQYIFDLCVTNHAATRYSHLFNFALGPQGWTAAAGLSGGWVGGKWIGFDNGFSLENRIELIIASTVKIDKVKAHINIEHYSDFFVGLLSTPSGASVTIASYDQGLGAGSTADQDANVDTGGAFAAGITGARRIYIQASGQHATAYAETLSITVEGPGADPF